MRNAFGPSVYLTAILLRSLNAGELNCHATSQINVKGCYKMAGKFFKEKKEQSLIKSTIVAKYFDVWENVIISTQKRYPHYPQKIAYIDLFAGPGRYKDGTQSTPLKILTNAIKKEELRDRLITIFNDKNETFSKDLEKTIAKIQGIEELKYRPKVYNQEVGEEIVKMFETMKLIPTLFFVDPWGYKGLSLRLVNSVLKDWGCDAIFFFNYNRISMGINNEAVQKHMQALFGEKKAIALRDKLFGKNSYERELLIIEELCQALKVYGSRYVLPFRFKNDKGKRTSHHLVFVSKNFRGYEIMKEIMARESTSETQGVPSFEYNPADFLPQQTLLFQLNKPMEKLKEDLLNTFRGSKLTMKEVYEKHNVDTPYIKKNYKDVLRKLYKENYIKAASPKGKPPRKDTFGDKMLITFPE
ncbi:MAG TPA: three-Cys-motif partner protein TcmP [Aequorivita sp.]|nr:three-Cys-motif partner protein TcmP [Aequorivita sp.]